MIFGIICIVIAVVALIFILRPSKEDREYDKELKKRLEDETIYDPETGANITLEQAESIPVDRIFSSWSCTSNSIVTIFRKY